MQPKAHKIVGQCNETSVLLYAYQLDALIKIKQPHGHPYNTKKESVCRAGSQGHATSQI